MASTSTSNNGRSMDFTPVETGDMSDIPPDLPAGAWEATCSVKKAKTSKDGFPMLILEWKTTEALTDGNEDFVGKKAAQFVVFWPANSPNSGNSKKSLKQLCEALDVEMPTATKLRSWDDLGDFIEALEGLQATIYTIVKPRKDNGQMSTEIRYTEPGSLSAAKASAKSEEDEDEEDEEEVKAPIKKKLKKKSSSN